MDHDSQFAFEHPVIPPSVCPDYVREFLGLAPSKRAMTTADGHLQCSCCTCKVTTDAAPAPAKPVISNAAAITAVLALKNLDARLQVLEQ